MRGENVLINVLLFSRHNSQFYIWGPKKLFTLIQPSAVDIPKKNFIDQISKLKNNI